MADTVPIPHADGTDTVQDDILKHHHRVEQQANQLAADMAETLETARESIIGRLARLEDKILKGKFEEEPAARRKALLEAQKAEVERLLTEVYAEMGTQLKEAGTDVMQATGAATTASMNAALGLAVTFSHLDRAAVNAWFEMSTVEGLLVNDWLKKLEQTAVDRIVGAGRQAMVEGLGAQAMARLMRQKGIQGSVPGLEGLARTWLQSAAHYAKEKTITDQFGDFITGWEYLATLDGRTCMICGPDDGRFFPLDEPKPTLPRHWRCRCTYLPKPPTWRELGIDMDEFESGSRPAVKHTGRTVHHKDGSTSTKFTVDQVEHLPGKTTYQAWMKRQLEEDPAFVRSVLGKTRFELFQAGKLELKAMSAHGRIKRLSEL